MTVSATDRTCGKATPRPWAVEDAKAVSLIRDSNGFLIASTHDDARIGGGPNRETRFANAALIVRAVNAHEYLVDALALARDELLSIHNQYGDSANAHEHSAALRAIRLTLAEAKGE